MSVHRGGYQDGAGAGRRPWTVEPLPLDLYPAFLVVSRFVWFPGRVLTGSSGYFVEYLLSRPDVKDVWRQFVYHPFVMAMGGGTLPIESFKGYIVQDYLYLVG